jgi:hypothetical protein
VLLSGCLHASAKSASDTPPLVAPRAPERVIETVDAAPVAPLPLVEEPPRQPIRTPAGPPPAPRVGAAPPRAQETPRSEAPPSDSPTQAAEPPPKPAPTLQTTPAGAEAEVERAIRAVIARTNVDLSRVDYRRLNQDARTQYDTAKRFIQQAEEALRPPRNLVFARNLVDKAAALAAQLAGR